MSRFGVDESVLGQMVSFAVHKGNLKWKLSSISTIRFYSDLHKFVTQKQLSYDDLQKQVTVTVQSDIVERKYGKQYVPKKYESSTTRCYHKTYLLAKSGRSSNQFFNTYYHLLILMSYSFLVHQQQVTCVVKNCQQSVAPRRHRHWPILRLSILTVMALRYINEK